MTITSKICAAVALAAMALPLMAVPLTVREPELNISLEDPPIFRFVNEANIEKIPKWLVLELTFTAVEKKETKDKFEWSDSIVVEFEMLMPSTHNGKDVFALLTGKATYWSIPMDGKKHHIQGFVHPQVLNRYLRAGIKLKKNAMDPIDARITFFSTDRRMLAQYYFQKKNVPEATTASRFNRAKDAVAGGVITVRNGIFSRDKTPWEFTNIGNQDLIKPEEDKSGY